MVSADPELTADQQAQALASIAKAEAALTDLQSAVDAATSTDQVHGIVKAALDALRQVSQAFAMPCSGCRPAE